MPKNANLIVIELKRTETGEHMELQAIRYAAMVSTLTFKRAVEMFQAFLDQNDLGGVAEARILDFLGWDEPQEEDFALNTRIVLVSHDFKKELTTSVMWLNERGLDIRCVQLVPHKHSTGTLVEVRQIIPLPEAESYQVRIRQQSEERREARESSKDYTQYLFDGNVYNKRKLVLAVVKKWAAINNPQSINELEKAFPQNLKSGGLFVEANVATEIYARQGIYRHFLGQDETFVFPNSTEYALSNQWGKNSVSEFIKHASSIGLEISEAI